jgi:hypothetical protein
MSLTLCPGNKCPMRGYCSLYVLYREHDEPKESSPELVVIDSPWNDDSEQCESFQPATGVAEGQASSS